MMGCDNRQCQSIQKNAALVLLSGISYDLNMQCVFNLSAFFCDLNHNTAFTEQWLYNYEK